MKGNVCKYIKHLYFAIQTCRSINLLSLTRVGPSVYPKAGWKSKDRLVQIA